jgi:hypothetical protein
VSRFPNNLQRKLLQRLYRRTPDPHFCTLYRTEDTARSEAMSCLDTNYPEHCTVLFVLCAGCRLTNYREQLTAKHREVWAARHGPSSTAKGA